MSPNEVIATKSETSSKRNTLYELSYAELGELREDFKNGMRYNEIRQKYNLNPWAELESNLLCVIQDLRDEKIMQSMEWNIQDVCKVLDYLNGCACGLVFWDKKRDIRNVEDLVDYIEYNDADFEMYLEWANKKEEQIYEL